VKAELFKMVSPNFADRVYILFFSLLKISTILFPLAMDFRE